MSFKKRIASMVLATVMSVSIMSISASASSEPYNLHYTAGAPSTVNVTSKELNLTASGGDRITVNSTTFSAYISGAYCEAKGIGSFPTNAANINSTGTYYLVYLGNSVPKSGVSVKVTTNLVNYYESRSATANGTITA